MPMEWHYANDCALAEQMEYVKRMQTHTHTHTHTTGYSQPLPPPFADDRHSGLPTNESGQKIRAKEAATSALSFKFIYPYIYT